MKEITLTQGKFAQVDDWNFEKLNRFKWCTARHKKRYYAVTRICGQNVYMHHMVLNTEGKIDHEDGNGLNNQEYNIREATHQQNCPVLALHLLYNYDQFKDEEPSKTIKYILDQLIPESKDGPWMDKCAMFFEVPLKDTTLSLFTQEAHHDGE